MKTAWLLILVVMLAGCVGTENAVEACRNLCQSELAKGTNLATGPCLGNPLANFTDWVCDVAHDPRQEIDNLPENQCSAYREGRAHHFVEVDPECRPFRVDGKEIKNNPPEISQAFSKFHPSGFNETIFEATITDPDGDEIVSAKACSDKNCTKIFCKALPRMMCPHGGSCFPSSSFGCSTKNVENETMFFIIASDSRGAIAISGPHNIER
jgi:hypothetical protein